LKSYFYQPPKNSHPANSIGAPIGLLALAFDIFNNEKWKWVHETSGCVGSTAFANKPNPTNY